MGYCCFCIPLTLYGVTFACVGLLSSFYNFIYLVLFSKPDLGTSYVLVLIFLEIVNVVVLVYLIVGIFQRRPTYFIPFLILTAVCICALFITACVFLLLSPAVVAICLAVLIAQCIVCFPIYLLYLEMVAETPVTL